MSIDDFTKQAGQYCIGVSAPSWVQQVVIRTEQGDSEIAAVHVEGQRLVIDLGKELP